MKSQLDIIENNVIFSFVETGKYLSLRHTSSVLRRDRKKMFVFEKLKFGDYSID